MYGRKPKRAPGESRSTHRKVLYVQENPLSSYDAGQKLGLTAPWPAVAYPIQNFFNCTYHYWTPDYWQTIRPTLSAGSFGEGLVIPPVTPASVLNWTLRKGVCTGLPYQYDNPWQNTGQVWHSGIAVGQAGLHAFELWWELYMLPPEFWIMTRQHRQFRINKITCRVIPRGQRHPTTVVGPGQIKVLPKLSIATTGDAYAADNPRIAGDITAGVAFTGSGTDVTIYANNQFQQFAVKTYTVNIPLLNMQQGMIGANFYRWLQISQLEALLLVPLKARPEGPAVLSYGEIIRARGGGRQVKGKVSKTRILHKPKWRAAMGIGVQPGCTPEQRGNHFQTGAISNVTVGSEDARFVFDGWGKMGWIDIPWGGYQPWYMPTSLYSQTYPGASSLIEPMQVPMFQFIVDASEWPTPFNPNGWPSSTTNATNPYQDFTIIAEQDAGAPVMLNPPLMWDVVFETEVEFRGDNDYKLMGTQAMLPGQS